MGGDLQPKHKLIQRYQRLYRQLRDLLSSPAPPTSRMATVAALLHHKMPHFLWTGFYTLTEGELVVGPYQGPLACQVLEKGKGVCWAGIQQRQTLIVPDVHAFPGHISCNSRSKSEIVVPLIDREGRVWGVLDVDSRQLNAFSEIDQEWLERIVGLI